MGTSQEYPWIYSPEEFFSSFVRCSASSPSWLAGTDRTGPGSELAYFLWCDTDSEE